MELDDGWKWAKEKKKKAYTAKRRERKKGRGRKARFFKKKPFMRASVALHSTNNKNTETRPLEVVLRSAFFSASLFVLSSCKRGVSHRLECVFFGGCVAIYFSLLFMRYSRKGRGPVFLFGYLIDFFCSGSFRNTLLLLRARRCCPHRKGSEAEEEEAGEQPGCHCC